MKITVDYRMLRALARRIASTEETRYYLCGVCVQPGIMVATNGHMLVAVKQEAPDGWTDVTIQRDQILRLPAWKRKAPTECEIEVNGGDVSITYAGMTLTAKSVDGTYPDWRRAIPKEWDYPQVAALFQQSVTAPLQAFAKDVGAVGPVRIQQNGYGPAWVHMSGVDAVGVAMPMRYGGAEAPKPEWLFGGENDQ